MGRKRARDQPDQFRFGIFLVGQLQRLTRPRVNAPGHGLVVAGGIGESLEGRYSGLAVERSQERAEQDLDVGGGERPRPRVGQGQHTISQHHAPGSKARWAG